MQRLLFTCLIFLFAKFTHAQEPKVTSIINFKGTIGTYSVEMQFRLVQKTDAIDGEYYYAKSGRDSKIYLNGTFKNDNLLLEERSYNSKKKKFLSSGYFKITAVNNTTISGTWGKSKIEANKPNALKVKLVCRENLNTLNPFKFKYSITKKKANYEDMSKVASSYYNITSFTIDNNRNNPQKITGFKELDLVDEKGEVELEDMNFDGYLDLKLMINYPDMSKGDYSYIYYIYDLKQARFVRDFVLDDIGVAFFDAQNRTVSKYDADGNGNEGTKTHKWQNGKLYLTKQQRVYEDDVFVRYKEYKIINGKSVEVKSYKKKE